MSQDIKRLCWRTSLICFEIITVITVLLTLVIGVLVLRLTTEPVDIGFAKNYIQDALRNTERGTYTTMDKLVLHWPDLNGPLLLGLQDVKVFDANDKVIIAIDEVALSLSKRQLLIGHIAPTALILKKPSLHVVRQKNGKIDIDFSAIGNFSSKETVTKDSNNQRAFAERILKYISRPDAELDSDSPLTTLKALKIQEARLVIDDHLFNTVWDIPRLDASFRSTQVGLIADFYTLLPSINNKYGILESNFLFSWDSHDIDLEASLTNFSPSILADKFVELSSLKDQDITFNAHISAKLNSDFTPQKVNFIIDADKGAVVIPEISVAPLPIKDLMLNAFYDDSTQKLSISEFKVIAKNVPIRAEGSFIYKNDTIHAPVKIMIDKLEQSKIAPLWPVIAKGDNSEKWIVERISNGTFYDAFVTMDLAFTKDDNGWNKDAKNIEAGFAFDDMNIDYRSPMIPVSKASGYGVFNYDKETLNIDIDQAMIADLNIKDAKIELCNIIESGAGTADIDIKLEGPFKDVLNYVSKEPIALEHDFNMSKIAGTADIIVNIKFPTSKNLRVKDVKVAMNGVLHNAVLPSVVQGLDLTEGPFKVSIADNQFFINGNGKLGGRKVHVNYNEFLNSKGKAYKNKVKVSLVFDPSLRKHFGINLNEFLEGSVPVKVTYTEFSGGRSEADVRVDLTSGRFFVEPFGYEKAIGVKGNARMKVILQNGVVKEILDLVASAPEFKLSNSHLLFHQQNRETELYQGHLRNFVIDESTGDLEFNIESDGRINISIEASMFDIRPFLREDENKNKIYNNPPIAISIKAKQMRSDDNQIIQYGKIYADIDAQGRFNQLEFDAIAGSGDIYLRFKPDETGKRTFRLEADNAGAALRAFGVYDKIVGGKLIAYAEPTRGIYDRNLLGAAEITNFKVVETPALARLLAALSLPGLLSALDNQGIIFTKLEANFDWLYRQDGGLLVLKEGRTSGNSLGLTFDGTFDKSAGSIDMSGTLVPLSSFNKLLSAIPLLGDILTGGSGGVFAATYKVKGKADDPEISVNPLSVLAPGILRRILFE